MKKNIILKVKGPMCKYNIVFLTVFTLISYASSLQGQNVVKRYEKEIDITENSLIKINAPRSVRITGNGQINTRQVGDKYIVSTKESAPHVFVIDKRLLIHTWESNRVKQVVDLSLKCETEDQQNALLKALSIDLVSNAAGVVEVNGELNIAQFKVDNGWFRADENSIQLRNGKEFSITYLALTTTLYIPKNSNLELRGEGNFISLEEHLGELGINMTGGELTAKKVGRIAGKIESVIVNVEELREGDLTIVNGTLKINKVESLTLECSLSGISIKNAAHLQISNSVNDRFIIGSVNNLQVDKSLYSNYEIESCSESVSVQLKNCDLSIGHLESTLKFAMIKNEGAKVQIGLDNLSTFSLICEGVHHSEFSIPSEFEVKTSDNMRKEYAVGQKPELTSIQIVCKLCDVDLRKSM